MFQDLRFGLRMLRRTPGSSILAVLCLTLGIGATAAVFSWVEGLLLRPYPLVTDIDRLMVLSGTSRTAQKGTDISWPDFDDLRRNCRLVDAFIAEKIVGTTLGVTADRAERSPGSVVSANYFDALGVHPVLGRGFEAVEEVGRNAHPVTVISFQLWQDKFHGDPSVIGRTLMMNAVPHTIVGVAPRDFYGTFVGYRFQFWVPASMQEMFEPGGYKLEDRGARWIEGFVKLKPGVTRAQAQEEIAAIADRLAAEYPETNRGRGLQLQPLWQSPFNPMEVLVPTLSIALVVVTAVLLIACANVGNLLLLNSFARRREMTIRLAVGAGRKRLVRQLLTEGCILSAIGAAGGLLVAYWSRNALVVLFPPRGSVVMRLPADLDARVLTVTAAVCLAATVLFALAPAVLTSGVDLVEGLKAEASGVLGGKGKSRVRSSLVISQVAISFVLLVGAGLVMRSLANMRAVDPGFSTDNVFVTSVDMVASGYDVQRMRAFQDELSRRLATVTGVDSSVFVRTTPFSYRPYSSAPIAVDGYEASPDEPPIVDYNEVGIGYFATLGLPLVSGRDFNRADDEQSDPVAIVNEAMVAKFWRGQDPLNRRLLVGTRPMRVVGVARTAKYHTLLEPPTPTFYVPLRQSPKATGEVLFVRARLRPGEIATAVAREVRALDQNLAPSEVIPMHEIIARTGSSQTMAVVLLSIFGGLALFLALIGLYGVMASAVTQGFREFGLRLALGAGRGHLLRMVLMRGLALCAAGVAIGGLAALELTRLLGTLLVNVSPRDPASYAAAFAVMAIAIAAACLLPAWRAGRVDPLIALRG